MGTRLAVLHLGLFEQPEQERVSSILTVFAGVRVFDERDHGLEFSKMEMIRA